MKPARAGTTRADSIFPTLTAKHLTSRLKHLNHRFKMLKVNIFKKLQILSLCLVAAVSFTSCSWVKDESDCVDSYNLVKFVYDYNMKFADAFSPEVKSITLMVFDSTTGKLVDRYQMPSSELIGGNELSLRVQPGSYDLLSWSGDYADSWDIPAGTIGESTLTEYTAYLKRAETDGKATVDKDVKALYHGLIHVDLPYASPSKPNRVTMPLMKDTNVVRVILQQISSEEVDASQYNWEITDGNGFLNYDNSIRSFAPITYKPWYLHTGSVDINTNPTTPGGSPDKQAPSTRAALGAALAEFTLSRLTMDTDPILHITNKKGETVLKINVRDYALLVKGYYNREMSSQEYLDRQDEYNMTFFLDDGGRWFSTVIIINDWRIIRHETPVS